MGSLVRRLERESLEQELEARQRDFKDVDRKYRWERNPADENALKNQRDDLLDKIKDIENRLQKLGIARKQELIEILQPTYQQRQYVILSAYRSSLPPRQIFTDNPSELSLSQLIVNLHLLVNGEPYIPIHKFIGFLLLDQHPEFELKEQLRTWIKEDIEDLTLLLAKVEQEKQDCQEQENPYLLVAISKRESQYMAEAWIIDHPKDYDRSQASGCQQIKINEKAEWPTDQRLTNMPALIRQLRDSCVKHHCEKSICQIHIFLPSELISHSVDTWKSDEDEDEEFSRTFGENYEVMVRYSERLRGKTEAILKWREKGRKMKQQLHQPASHVFLPGNNSRPKSLFNQLTAETTIAVTLTSPARQKELGLLLRSGIPLALWIRNTMPHVDCPSVLDRCLGGCQALQTLPSQVKATRREAFDEDEPNKHVGRHLALLWDDPDLVPPKQLLTQQNL